jgi:hypothetical protein
MELTLMISPMASAAQTRVAVIGGLGDIPIKGIPFFGEL